MSIEISIQSSKIMIEAMRLLMRFSKEDNDVMDLCRGVFDKIKSWDNSISEKESKYGEATIGIIVGAICLYYTRYELSKDKNMRPNAYLWYIDHNQFYKSKYYPIKFEKMLKVCNISQTKTETKEEFYQRLVLTIGSKVMQGKLPFPAETFTEIFDTRHKLNTEYSAEFYVSSQSLEALKNFVHSVSVQVQSEPERDPRLIIEKKFDSAINEITCLVNRTQNEEKFLLALCGLKCRTVANFKNKQKNFNFDESLFLADSVNELASKVKLARVTRNILTQSDIDNFVRITGKYRTCSFLAVILTTVVSTLVAILAFNLVSGAVVGGFALAFTMWYHRTDPLHKVGSQATEIIKNQYSLN